jgi:hypothetical protein
MITNTYTTTGVRNIGEAAEGAVGSWVLQFSGTGTYSVTLRKKIRRGTVADASAPTTFYELFNTGVSTAAGTAITGAALVKVACDGCDLILDVTAVSGGTLVVEAEPLLG